MLMVRRLSVRFSPVTLRVFQVLTLAVNLFALGMFILAIPYRMEALHYWQLQQQGVLLSFLGRQPASFIAARSLIELYPYGMVFLESLLMALLALSAAIIFLRRYNQPMALILMTGLVTHGVYITPAVDQLMVDRPEWRFAGHLVQSLGITMPLLFFYLFPEGRFRPRWLVVLMAGWLLWTGLWLALQAPPFDVSNPFQLPFVSFVVLMVYWISGIFALIHPIRSGTNMVLRQQTKFIVYGVAIAAVSYALYIPLSWLIPLVDPSGAFTFLFDVIALPVHMLCLLAGPATITFSILRYRLWTIDVVINRTLTYGVLTTILAMAYTLVVVGLQTLFRAINNPQESQVVTAVSTLVIALLFQPVRNRVQMIIEQSFYRRRYNAEKTLTDFAERVRSEVDLEMLARDLHEVVMETMQPQHASLILRKEISHNADLWAAFSARPEAPDPAGAARMNQNWNKPA